MTQIEQITINGVICNLYVTDSDQTTAMTVTQDTKFLFTIIDTTPVDDLRIEVINKLKQLFTF